MKKIALSVLSFGLLAFGFLFLRDVGRPADERVLGESVSVTSSSSGSVSVGTVASVTPVSVSPVSSVSTVSVAPVSSVSPVSTKPVTSVSSVSTSPASSVSTTTSSTSSGTTIGTSTTSASSLSSASPSPSASGTSTHTSSTGTSSSAGTSSGTVVSAPTVSVKPGIPTGLRSEVIAPRTVRLRWQASSGGSGSIRYLVNRDGTLLSNTEGVYYDDPSVEGGKTYSYVIQAVDGQKNVSGWTESVSVTVPASESETTVSGDEKPVILTVGVAPEPDKVFVDSDSDGLSDAEEVRLGTDPDVSDTDGDGFRDSEEIRGGFDPLKYSPGDKRDRISYESPKSLRTDPVELARREDERYSVRSVQAIEVDAKARPVFSGVGLPNSYLTLFIYSDPIIVTVLTDDEGNWSYALDRDLEAGDHEAYVAVTDSMGRITAQSKALPFTKTAEALTMTSQPFPTQAAEQGNRSFLSRSLPVYIGVGVGIAVIFIAVILLVIRGRLPRSDA